MGERVRRPEDRLGWVRLRELGLTFITEALKLSGSVCPLIKNGWTRGLTRAIYAAYKILRCFRSNGYALPSRQITRDEERKNN